MLLLLLACSLLVLFYPLVVAPNCSWSFCCCRRSHRLIPFSICLLYITFAILYLNTFSLLLLSFCSLVLHTREQVCYSSILYLWYFVMLTSASHPRTESGFNSLTLPERLRSPAPSACSNVPEGLKVLSQCFWAFWLLHRSLRTRWTGERTRCWLMDLIRFSSMLRCAWLNLVGVADSVVWA